MQGIYAITNTATGEQYVGKARHIYHRWSQHTYLLALGRHPSPTFTRAWANHGATGFTWRILQVVDDARDLLRVEQEHIARLRPAYNQRDALRLPSKPAKPKPGGHPYWLRTWEAAERMGETEETVRVMLRDGKLRGMQISKRAGWRMRAEDVDAFIQSRFRTPEQPEGQ